MISLELSPGFTSQSPGLSQGDTPHGELSLALLEFAVTCRALVWSLLTKLSRGRSEYFSSPTGLPSVLKVQRALSCCLYFPLPEMSFPAFFASSSWSLSSELSLKITLPRRFWTRGGVSTSSRKKPVSVGIYNGNPYSPDYDFVYLFAVSLPYWHVNWVGKSSVLFIIASLIPRTASEIW